MPNLDLRSVALSAAKAHAAMTKLGPAMRAAASAFGAFAKTHEAAINAELDRRLIAHAVRPLSQRSLREIERARRSKTDGA